MLTFDVLGPSGAPRLFGAIVNSWDWVPPGRLYDLTAMQDGGSGAYSQWHPTVDCDGANYLVAFNGYPGGYLGLGAAEFGWWYQRFYGWRWGCLESQLQIAQDPNGDMGAHLCAESSGNGTRHNTLIASQHWRSSSPGTGGVGGDPFVALHAH
jgi:hypothetical protein